MIDLVGFFKNRRIQITKHFDWTGYENPKYKKEKNKMNFIKAWLLGYLEKKAGLYEGTPVDGQPWYKSKTILSDILTGLMGAYMTADQIMQGMGKPGLPPIPPALLVGLAMVGIKGRIEASKPITFGPAPQPPQS